MAVTDYKLPGTASNDTSVGSKVWESISNIKQVLNYSYSDGYGTDQTNYAKASNFGFSIPGGATIDGIEIIANKMFLYEDWISDYDVRLVLADGSFGSENLALAGDWPEDTAQDTTYGGSSELFSESLNVSDVNDSDFGFAISGEWEVQPGGCTAYIYYIKMRVYYTEDSHYPLPSFNPSY